MTGSHYQSFFSGQFFQVFFNQAILHPVLTDLTGFSVGDQLVRIERHIKVQVIIDHDLKRTAFDAAAVVIIDRPSLDMPRGSKAVAVDSAPGQQFFQEFGGQQLVPFFRNVAQGIF